MQAIIVKRAWSILLYSFCVLGSILAVPESGAAQDIREEAVKYTGSYALVIGISDYTDWPKLSEAKKDVTEVAKALENHGFQVKKVIDPPNLAELENAYKDFIRKHGRNEYNRLLFYFAGHAHDVSLPPGEKVGHLVARDAPFPPETHANFRDYTMNLEKFGPMAREIDAKHVLFLFDSCFSGARGFPLGIAKPEDFQRKVGKRTAEYVRQIISAGTADQRVPDKSFFRRVFVEALEEDSLADLNKDSYVTGSELGKYLQERVPIYWRWQTPQYGKLPGLDKGDFVFDIRSIMPQPLIRPRPPQLQKKIRAPQKTRKNDPSNTEFEFMLIPAGEFTMGAKEGPSSPLHRVTISRPFYVSTTEVTQDQWLVLMGNNPSRFKGNGNRPVENVSWHEVQEFIQKLNAREGTNTYRLPTEAEWEWAARAGSVDSYNFGNNTAQLKPSAWCPDNADEKTHIVATLAPNEWGLYDMQGNVWEWCQDWYGDYSAQSEIETDPKGASTGGYRVYRGGGWRRGHHPGTSESSCQVTTRYGARPHFSDSALGFRLVMEVPVESNS